MITNEELRELEVLIQRTREQVQESARHKKALASNLTKLAGLYIEEADSDIALVGAILDNFENVLRGI